MSTYEIFSLIILISILFPVASFMLIISLGFLEREVDFLEIENKKVSLEKELHQSKFLQLNQQIQPHFLFNTLNAILTLGRLGRLKDIVHALEKLSLFLRYNYLEKDSLVPWDKEWKHTENYLAIQKIRFGEKLKTSVSADREARRTLLPPYTLQTLVENAFKHGLDHKLGEKTIGISLRREGNWVCLSVLDNGPGASIVDQETASGVGLDNLRKRFTLTFNLPTEIILKRTDCGLTEAKALWPYTPEEEDDDEDTLGR